MKKLNLPNKLTVLRIILVPIFIALMAIASIKEELSYFAFIALGVYVVASITDFIDGKIARKYNLITDFGKIMDPLADKILVASGFIMLAYLQTVPGWVVAIIVCRDFFVDGLRMIASTKNTIVAASLSGKIKTAFQMITIILAICSYPICEQGEGYALSFLKNDMSVLALFFNVFMSVGLMCTLIATIWSLIEYIVKFSKILSVEKEEEKKLLNKAKDN